MRPGLKLHQRSPAGRDPREMTQDELREAGHEPKSPLQALRAHCLDCCVYQEKEVALCTAVKCPSWPFRMGTDPWRKPASQARREAARQGMARINARRRERGEVGSPASPPEHGIATSPATGSGVAPVWATARANADPGMVRHRVEGDGADQNGDQFGDGQISVLAAGDENPDVRAG
jgi:hypothetical protein